MRGCVIHINQRGNDMNTKLGMLKQAALSVCLAGGLSVMPIAQADSYGVTYNSGYSYYDPYAYNPPRCYYDYYGYYRCYPYYSYPEYYDYGPYCSPGITFSYYGGFGHRWRSDRDDWRWHDRTSSRWHH
jgi:hypothetical protein